MVAMASSSSFDNLVAELTAEERVKLRDRIRMAMPVSEEPLFPASAAPGAIPPPAAKLEELGFVARLVLFLRGLFSGRSREEILREDELREIGRRVEAQFPGILDRRRGLLLGAVAEELRGLRDAARFFYNALDRSVERDRPSFYAFLGSVELPQTHERLIAEADPEAIAASMAEARGAIEDKSVRSAALAAFESILSDISDKGRRAMYQDLRSVLFLKRLSGFLFDRLIGAFREGAAPDAGLSASFFDLRELLLDLGDILFSMSEAPSTELIGVIFAFAEREELVREEEEEASALLNSDMAKAESSLGRIRSFNARVPLGDLLKLATGDPAYLPRELPGGEDWLAVYRAYWRESIEAALAEWRAEHRNKALVEEIAAFVGEPGPAGFAHISREEREDSPPLRLDLALVFLDAFHRGPFLRELNRPLKTVLVDGEFYRKDNRVEFTDAYDALTRLPELLSALDARLGPEGELGAAWRAAGKELGGAAKRRKIQSISRGVEEEAERIIAREGSALRTMVNILQGFLKGEAGGRYDSLANLSTIESKSNKEFLRSLGHAKDRCEKALALLAELSGLEFSLGE
jgi:hypothetical protein